MPNICGYSMSITGKESQVNELIQIMQNDYDGTPNEPLHLWRVFSAEEVSREVKDDLVTVLISGDCAWSVGTCMFEGGYQAQFNANNERNGTTLEKETKRLGLAVEIYSEECGCAFMEHYIVASGNIIEDECVEWLQCCMDGFENVEEFNEFTGLNWTKEQFEKYDEEYYEVGGMDWDFEDGEFLYHEYVSPPIIEEEADIDEVSEEELNAILSGNNKGV